MPDLGQVERRQRGGVPVKEEAGGRGEVDGASTARRPERGWTGPLQIPRTRQDGGAFHRTTMLAIAAVMTRP